MIKLFACLLPLAGLLSAAYGNSPVKFSQPRIKNYPQSIYKADNQNWNIGQDSRGTLYFANNLGLLTFDGNTWRNYPLPDEMIVRSLEVLPSGRIYTGSYEEFGYWEKDGNGELRYTSLKPLLKGFVFQNEEIWKIITRNGITYFQSFNVIFAFNGNTIRVIHPPGIINCFAQVHDELYVLISGDGLYRLKDYALTRIDKTDFFRERMIRVLLPYEGRNLLVATADDGIFVYDTLGKLSKWGPGQAELLKKGSINRGTITQSGLVVIGTILNGILIYDQKGNLLFHINKKNGLQHNTVLDVFMDIDGMLWAGLDNGIDLISPDSNITFYYDQTGELGSVYDIEVNNEILYAGTNQGLFYCNIGRSARGLIPNFQFIENSQGQVWSIDNFDGQLICGHNEGTFEIKGHRIESISPVTGGFSCCKVIFDSREYLLQSTYTDLVLFHKQEGKWKFSHTIENFRNPIRHIGVDHLGNVWASHWQRGLYRLRLNHDYTAVHEKKFYGLSNGFASDYHINVFSMQNRIVFTNEGKVYTYNDLYDTIMQFDFVESQIRENSFVTGIFSAGDNLYWFSTLSSLDLYEIRSGKLSLYMTVPYEQLDHKIIRHNENIYTAESDKWIVGLENGMAILQPGLHQNLILNKSAYIQKIISSGKRELTILPSEKKTEKTVELPFNQNSIVFHYSCPVFYASVRFLLKLEGIDEEWIQTGLATYKYDRLPPGSYLFRVKAMDGDGNTSMEGQFDFIVASPWYWSKASILLYFVLMTGLFFMIRTYVLQRLKKQEIRLSLEKERELIELKNEKLQTEVHYKSLQLANTTYSMIKKNELLMEMKKLLSRSRRNIDPADWTHFKDVLHLLDSSITNEDDWKAFESNFEQAHEEFLKRIKKKYPGLTPSDLKLCAYIRMNLSSKKIAPLLGISMRGVENHRYRLRKKMGLGRDINLTSFIMEF